MTFGNLVHWFLVIFLSVRRGGSIRPSGTGLLLDDEDLTVALVSGSGDSNGTVGEVREDVIVSVDNGATALLWTNENGSASAATDKARKYVFGNEQAMADMLYIDDEEVAASGMWRNQFDGPGGLKFMPEESSTQQEGSSSGMYGLPIRLSDGILTYIESSHGNDAGYQTGGPTIDVADSTMVYHPCSSVSNPCKANERCVASGSSVICERKDTEEGLTDLCRSQPCHNNGICHYNGSDATFSCECPKGFAGLRCDLKDPCYLNPCPRGCICTMSDEHALNYRCESPQGLTVEGCDFSVPEIHCHDDKILIDVSRMFREDFENIRGSLQLLVSNVPDYDTARDEISCQVQANGTDWQMIIPAPFTRCGTARLRSGNGNDLVVRNQLWVHEMKSNDTMPLVQAQFECRYKAIYEPVGYVKLNQAKDKESGPFIELCKVKSCPNACPKEHFVDTGSEFGVTDTIHLTITDENLSENEVLSVENVGFACDETEVFRGISIKTGCNVNPESFVESSVGSVSCLSLRMPLRLSCANASLHVEVASCPATDVQMCVHNATILGCTGTFSRRLKRSPKPRAKNVAAFNAHYKNAGEANVKFFALPAKVRSVSSPNAEERGYSENAAFIASAGILLAVVLACFMYFSKTN